MLFLINNLIDLGKIAAAIIAIFVLLIIFIPWRKWIEVVLMLMLYGIIFIEFHANQLFLRVTRVLRRKKTSVEFNDHEWFI